jgi:hypothetical protein
LPAQSFDLAKAPNAIVTGDFNGDGHADLAVTSRSSDTVSFLFGKGDGTFQPQSGTRETGGKTPYAMLAGDFDSNDKMDIAIANRMDQDFVILMGRGDGTFKDPIILYPTG